MMTCSPDAFRPLAVWTGRATLGEGPLWSPSLGLVLFVDIKGARLIGWAPDGGAATEWPMPEPCCWLVARSDGDGFVAGLQSRVVHLRLDPKVGAEIVETLAKPEADQPGVRLNDAKADLEGRIWFGSMDDAEAEVRGHLWRFGTDGAVTQMDDGYMIANGPAVSPDGRTLYHTDSAARTIYAFDLAPDGTLASKRVHIRFGEDDGYPDGMTTDAQGGLWVAHWDGGRITRFTPEGARERAIALPCSRVTSACFFGPGLDRLAITSAAIGKNDEPLAGSLFVVDSDVPGCPPATWGGR